MSTTPQQNYWEETVAVACEEAGVILTREQLGQIAGAVESSHENYGMAFYSPPASDRVADMTREWKSKLKRAQDELDRYRKNAETAIKQALRQRADAQVSIGEYGEVELHDGRTTRIQ